jgi:hypothetical protein
VTLPILLCPVCFKRLAGPQRLVRHLRLQHEIRPVIGARLVSSVARVNERRRPDRRALL